MGAEGNHKPLGAILAFQFIVALKTLTEAGDLDPYSGIELWIEVFGSSESLDGDGVLTDRFLAMFPEVDE